MNGKFDSNIQNTPAVTAIGTNGALGVDASSDNGGIALRGASTGVAGEQNAAGGTGVAGSAEFGGIGVFGRVYGVDENHSPGFGVSGIADRGGTGVYGQASGADERDNSPARGVSGFSPDGVGVRGEAGSERGMGVAGYASEGGVGVHGESPRGFAMRALGSTMQSLDSGGWVKAMVHVVWPKKALPSIDRLFNSQPSSIQVYGEVPGVLLIDFGFSVEDRFVNATTELRSAYWEPNNRGNLGQGWHILPFDDQGNDVAHLTESLSPPLNVAMVSFPQPTVVQVELFKFQMDPKTLSVSYQRANGNVLVTVF